MLFMISRSGLCAVLLLPKGPAAALRPPRYALWAYDQCSPPFSLLPLRLILPDCAQSHAKPQQADHSQRKALQKLLCRLAGSGHQKRRRALAAAQQKCSQPGGTQLAGADAAR